MSSGRRYIKTIGKWGYEGVTATFVHRTTGERRTVYEPGRLRREALRQACRQFEPGEWKCDVISTPQSIYDDLTFARKLIDPSSGERGRDSRHMNRMVAFSAGGTLGPEPSLLGNAGCAAWL